MTTNTISTFVGAVVDSAKAVKRTPESYTNGLLREKDVAHLIPSTADFSKIIAMFKKAKTEEDIQNTITAYKELTSQRKTDKARIKRAKENEQAIAQIKELIMNLPNGTAFNDWQVLDKLWDTGLFRDKDDMRMFPINKLEAALQDLCKDGKITRFFAEKDNLKTKCFEVL